MPQTYAEKILARHGYPPAKPGETGEGGFDFGVLTDIASPDFLNALKTETFFKAAKKFIFSVDHLTPPDSIASANIIKAMRQFARAHDIEFLEIGRSGIANASLPDEGRVLPGSLLVGCDPHISAVGAIGALGISVPIPSLAHALVADAVSLPAVGHAAIELTGELPDHVHGFDLCLHLLKEYGSGRFAGKIIEFTGPSVINLPMSERFKLCHFSTELGAVAGVFFPDERGIEYVKRRTQTIFDVIAGDKSSHADAVRVDMGNVRTLVKTPGGDIRPVEEIKNQKVDSIFIGSDAGGYFDDIHLAVGLMRGKSVKHPLTLLILPATKGAYSKVVSQGLMNALIQSGANVAFPTMGPFIGRHTGVLGPGQVGLATFSRNAKGQMGDPASEVFLASPAVAAATAVTGVLTHPAQIA